MSSARRDAGLMALGVGLGCAALSLRPVVDLRPQVVRSSRSASSLRAALHEMLRGHEGVMATGEAIVVSRFRGTAGPFHYATVEQVQLTADGATFRHLHGPFVSCEETITVRADPDGSIMTHAGRIRLRGGVVGWLFGLAVVRPVFDAHVRHHLGELIG